MLVGIVLTTGRLNGAGQKTNPKIKHTFRAFRSPLTLLRRVNLKIATYATSYISSRTVTTANICRMTARELNGSLFWPQSRRNLTPADKMALHHSCGYRTTFIPALRSLNILPRSRFAQCFRVPLFLPLIRQLYAVRIFGKPQSSAKCLQVTFRRRRCRSLELIFCAHNGFRQDLHKYNCYNTCVPELNIFQLVNIQKEKQQIINYLKKWILQYNRLFENPDEIKLEKRVGKETSTNLFYYLDIT